MHGLGLAAVHRDGVADAQQGNMKSLCISRKRRNMEFDIDMLAQLCWCWMEFVQTLPLLAL